jgi:hypothetical protein
MVSRVVGWETASHNASLALRAPSCPPGSRTSWAAINNMQQSGRNTFRGAVFVCRPMYLHPGVRGVGSPRQLTAHLEELRVPGGCRRTDLPRPDSRLESAILLLNHRRAASRHASFCIFYYHLLHCCNPFLPSVCQEGRSTCIRFPLISTPFAHGPCLDDLEQTAVHHHAANRTTTSL